MSKLIETAKEYLGYNLSVIPTSEDKRPAITNWKTFTEIPLSQEELEDIMNKKTIRPEVETKHTNNGKTYIDKGVKLYKDVTGLGILTGSISGGLEVIDVDTKYCIKGDLWEEFRDLIENTIPDTYKSLVIARTISGGYHIYYKCETIGGNTKLANRPTT